MAGWREPVIRIISTKMSKEDVDLITLRWHKNVPGRGGFIKRVRYIIDDRGIFYWSDRYDKNYTHLF